MSSAIYRGLPIVAAMLVSFLLTLAFLHWQRTEQPAAPGTGDTIAVPPLAVRTSSSGQSASSGPSAWRMGPRDAADGRATGVAMAQTAAHSAAAEMIIPPSNQDGPPLPVVFGIQSRLAYTTEDDAYGVTRNVTKNMTEGVLYNSSDNPVTVTVIESNIGTQESSHAQFVLDSGLQQRFGIEQGLKMQSGDQITLRSPSYRDLTQQVP